MNVKKEFCLAFHIGDRVDEPFEWDPALFIVPPAQEHPTCAVRGQA